ncbi:MAG: S-layer homology domain-containing protein [Thermodesulfovibrionales bacterium]
MKRYLASSITVTVFFCAFFLQYLTAGAATYPGSATLTVTRMGMGMMGSGVIITSSPAGIDCGSACSGTFPVGTAVTLTAADGSGAAFSGWSGACKNTDTICTVTMDSDMVVGAHALTGAMMTFSDVQPGYWASDYIEAMYNNGMTMGCGNGSFCPDDEVTRGQMAAFLIREKYGENFSYTQMPYFTDVPSTNGYFKYVQKLKDDGITNVSGTFGVDDPVTRSQAAALTMRSKYGDTFSYTMTPYFSDVPSDNSYFSYVQKVKDDGITVMSGSYLPDGTMTRADMSAFMSRAFLQMH